MSLDCYSAMRALETLGFLGGIPLRHLPTGYTHRTPPHRNPQGERIKGSVSEPKAKYTPHSLSLPGSDCRLAYRAPSPSGVSQNVYQPFLNGKWIEAHYILVTSYVIREF